MGGRPKNSLLKGEAFSSLVWEVLWRGSKHIGLRATSRFNGLHVLWICEAQAFPIESKDDHPYTHAAIKKFRSKPKGDAQIDSPRDGGRRRSGLFIF